MDKRFRKWISVLLLLVLLLAAVSPAAKAQDAGRKVVRVGWFDSSFCYWDDFGRRCGIAYEYQHRIAAYTGWTYEYVEDSWPNLLKMLMDGKIDLLSDVSYKPDREEFIAYPDLPMGTESYYIFIASENREITADNPASFSGKRIGVNQGSIQEGYLKDWADKYGVSLEIVPLLTEEDDSMDMVIKGRLDGFATTYSLSSKQKVVPVCRIGSSDYFFAVNKNRTDLLAELNVALAGIRDEDPYFTERLAEEHLYDTRTYISLTPAEEDWLASHSTIRVGYLKDFFPFCSTDEKTGRLTGALNDYLIHAESHLNETGVRFETVPYATVSAALAAMKAGEVDCVFPVFLSDYDADEAGVLLTNPAMKTGMNTVMRDSEIQSLSRNSELSIAIIAGEPNSETFVKEQYPSWRWLAFPDEAACFEAVASDKADCALVSNYRIPSVEETIKRLKLYSVPTGEHIPMSFAVNLSDRELYFLLNKTVLMTGSGEMDSALASYMHTNQKVTFLQFLRDNWIYVIAVLTVLFSLIVFLLLQRLKSQRKAHEQERLLAEAAEIAELKQTITSLLDNLPGMTFTKDANTGTYLACTQAFGNYAHKRSPEEVAGLTPAQLFDEETAKHFAEDDRMALSMDGPYIYFDDVADTFGSRRQIKSTRLKYTDATGRLCVLGILQDVTDQVRIHRGDATTGESYEKARSTGIIYSHIAQALARGYQDLYYIDLNTEEFIEYRTDPKGGSLTEARRGWHFFEECQEEVDQLVYAEDREAVKKALDRKTLVAALDQDGTFMMTYRLVINQVPKYVSLTVTRMQDDDSCIILGVMDVDEQMQQRSAAAKVREEQVAYSRLSALAGDFLCIYVVVPETGRYREFSASAGFDSFTYHKEGSDFFADAREHGGEALWPDDLNRYRSTLTRENVLADIERHGIFSLSYRLKMEGKPHYVQMKVVMVEEKEGRRLIVGVNDIDAQVRQEEEYANHLARAKIEATVDALTGVKNRHAYRMAEERLNAQIAEGVSPEFAIVILDVNDLKKVNDTDGHKAGDHYLRDACRIVCRLFSHSPVFRVGGDEFAVIAQGDDYADIDNLVGRMHSMNEESLSSGGIVIACGMAKREDDANVAAVFERADQQMYENKGTLKSREK